MGYWRDVYGQRSDEFIKGALAAVDTYGIWKDGVQRIGAMGKPVKEVKEEIKKDLAYIDNVG